MDGKRGDLVKYYERLIGQQLRSCKCGEQPQCGAEMVMGDIYLRVGCPRCGVGYTERIAGEEAANPEALALTLAGTMEGVIRRWQEGASEMGGAY